MAFFHAIRVQNRRHQKFLNAENMISQRPGTKDLADDGDLITESLAQKVQGRKRYGAGRSAEEIGGDPDFLVQA